MQSDEFGLNLTVPHDGLVRPKLTYSMLSNLDIRVSADIFNGNEEGLFGQFDRSDRVVAGFRLGF